MQNFNEFITNIADYNSSIAQGNVRPFIQGDLYLGQDLTDLITKSGDQTNPKVVAALETVQGYNRAHAMRMRTPKDYYANQARAAKLKNAFYTNILLPEFNAAKGDK